MGKKSRTKREKKNRATSTLDQHSRAGSRLLPPLLKLPNMRPVSWSSDELPEMLWAALLVTDLGRVRALSRFREVAAFVQKQQAAEKTHDVSHSALATLDPVILAELLGVIARGARYAAALSPLLLLESLPARDAWVAALQHAEEKKGWESLMEAVAKVFEHQSQEATDCRWLKVLVALLAGRLQIPWPDRIDEILEYPARGDMKRVRPSIRATEMALRRHLDEVAAPLPWADQFWSYCYERTTCFDFVSGPVADRAGIRLEEIEALYNSISAHAQAMLATTAPDPRHDISFGIALYAVTVLHELVGGRVDGGVLGQVALRVIAESAINFAYLLHKDDAELWASFRAYGAGQAKLTFLKFEDIQSPPNSIDVETLRALANEDLWQEFVPIELGHWDKSNLRKMSDDASVKDSIYDPFYQWPSQFAHGQWGAIRDTVFDNCANPLHRFHRLPRVAPRQLPPTVDQAIMLVNLVLDLLDRAYPLFKLRIAEIPLDNGKISTPEAGQLPPETA